MHSLQYFVTKATPIYFIDSKCNKSYKICLTDYYGCINFPMSISFIYGTAQFKLDIYTCVTLELFNQFVEPLASYTRVHDTIS